MIKNFKRIIIIDLVLTILMVSLVWYWFYLNKQQNETINKLGHKKTENQNINQNQTVVQPKPDKSDLIRITNITPNQIVFSPLNIEGEARGTWFFEASFPITLLDQDRKIITQGIAQAIDDWMTTDFVKFKTKLEFTKPTTKQGFLIFKKDNPSGLPQYDDSYEIVVSFE